MGVVVVNCSTWPTFPSLVRTRALDLYPLREGVEFWDARSPQRPADLRIWGNWPKCFGEPLWLLRDELWDLVPSQAPEVVAGDSDNASQLTIIVLFDAAAPTPRRPNSQRTAPATVISAMDAIANRIAAERPDDSAALRRMIWRIAVFRNTERGGARGRRPDDLPAAARDLVVPRPRPISVDQDTNSAEPVATFDTAMLIDGGIQGGSDESDFAVLRVLIDIVRDERSRAVLKPSTPLSEQRIWRFSVPRVRSSPSDQILANLAMLASNYDALPVHDVEDDPLKQPVSELQEAILTAKESRLSGAAKTRSTGAVASSSESGVEENDANHDEELRQYFQTDNPGLAPLVEDAEPHAAVNVLDAARNRLAPFLQERHAALVTMRQEQDSMMRYYGASLDRVERAATDRSFGQSGRVLRSIETALGNLSIMQEGFIEQARKQRRDLNDEYHLQLATARSERRSAPELSDFAEVAKFDTAKDTLIVRLANSTTLLRFRVAWALFSGVYALLVGLVTVVGSRESPLGPAIVAAAVMIASSSLIAAVALLFVWRWFQKRRSQAMTATISAYAAAVERIDKVTRLALAHLASSRMAGRLEPFIRMLAYRERDLRELRAATERVFAVIKFDGRRAARALRADNTAKQTLENKLMGAAAQDSLKIVLGEMGGSPKVDVEIAFSQGEMTNSIAAKMSLVLDPPIVMTFIRPPARARPANETSRAPVTSPDSAPPPRRGKTSRPAAERRESIPASTVTPSASTGPLSNSEDAESDAE
jgi:hypothetical protein